MNIQVNVEGLAEIERKLKQLPEKIGRNAMRRALRKGANVIRDAARSNARRIDDPETREQIWKNLAVASGGRRREKEVGGVMMRVGVLGGAKQRRRGGGTYEVGGSKENPGGDTFYWRFLELGTSQMPAQPFLTPAGAEKAQAAYDATAADMIKQIDKELSKLG